MQLCLDTNKGWIRMQWTSIIIAPHKREELHSILINLQAISERINASVNSYQHEFTSDVARPFFPSALLRCKDDRRSLYIANCKVVAIISHTGCRCTASCLLDAQSYSLSCRKSQIYSSRGVSIVAVDPIQCRCIRHNREAGPRRRTFVTVINSSNKPNVSSNKSYRSYFILAS